MTTNLLNINNRTIVPGPLDKPIGTSTTGGTVIRTPIGNTYTIENYNISSSGGGGGTGTIGNEPTPVPDTGTGTIGTPEKKATTYVETYVTPTKEYYGVKPGEILRTRTATEDLGKGYSKTSQQYYNPDTNVWNPMPDYGPMAVGTSFNYSSGFTAVNPNIESSDVLPVPSPDFKFSPNLDLENRIYAGQNVIQHPESTIDLNKVAFGSPEYRIASEAVATQRGEEQWAKMSWEEKALTSFTSGVVMTGGIVAGLAVLPASLAALAGVGIVGASTASVGQAFKEQGPSVFTSPEFVGGMAGSAIAGGILWKAGSIRTPRPIEANEKVFTASYPYEVYTESGAIANGPRTASMGIAIQKYVVPRPYTQVDVIAAIGGRGTALEVPIMKMVNAPKNYPQTLKGEFVSKPFLTEQIGEVDIRAGVVRTETKNFWVGPKSGMKNWSPKSMRLLQI